ncbi:MAG: DUF4435 domain-containing protein [Bdellovibrionales bacterium]|nr:DUF4435 domain-containing protein [Bdellovibrionales bacterium]
MNQLTVDEVISEIKISLASSVFLIVEGPSDIKFFNYFLEIDDLTILHCGSCEKVIEAARKSKQFETSNKTIIAVIDRDYRCILRDLPEEEYIFVTDKHDIESTMFTKVVSKGVLKTFINKEKTKAKYGAKYLEVLYQKVINIAMRTSGCRFNAEKLKKNKGTSISFKGTEIDRYINNNFVFNFNSFCNAVKKIATNNKKSIDSIFDVDVDSLVSLEEDVLIWTRGHDLIDAVHALSKSKLSNSKVEKIEIKKLLKVSYGDQSFVKSQLYADISAYLK